VGAVTRLTGLSPHVLRAWERRYGAVSPLRSHGGTRRYRESDVARLRLLCAAVEAGQRIGDVARLSDAELRARVGALEDTGPRPAVGPLLEAVERLDTDELDRLLGVQLAALGPRLFTETVAVPLLRAIGEGWERGEVRVASEHLASVLVRSLLGAVLHPRGAARRGPRILFTTPAGERHELGVLMSAVTAAEAGARCTYLGPDLPVEEIAGAATRLGADVVALGIACLARADAEAALRALRGALRERVAVWIGGAGSRGLELPRGVERLDLPDLDGRIALLAERRAPEAG
jgi:DNA-binding transcriptional MerR regulator/methylmalonyl-CoA mutase cobalamin-binding subunit